MPYQRDGHARGAASDGRTPVSYTHLVLFATERAGDIVGDGRHLQNKLRVCVQPCLLYTSSTLPTAGNTVFLSHSRNWFHRLCRKCVCLYRTACQQGKGHHSRHANRNRLFHSIVSSSYCVSLLSLIHIFITSSSTRRAKSSSGKANANGIQYMPSCRAAFMYSL